MIKADYYNYVCEARDIAEKLMEYWERVDPEQYEYYNGVFNALGWVADGGFSPMYSDDETAFLN